MNPNWKFSGTFLKYFENKFEMFLNKLKVLEHSEIFKVFLKFVYPEHLNSNILKCFQNKWKYFRTLQNVSEQFEMFRNKTKSFRTLWRQKQSTKQVRMFRNTFWKLLNVSKHFIKCFQNIKKCFRTNWYFRININILEHSEMFVNKTKCYWFNLNVFQRKCKYFRTLQNVSQHIWMFRNKLKVLEHSGNGTIGTQVRMSGTIWNVSKQM